MLDDPLPFRPAAGLLALSIQCCCSFSYTLHFWDLLQKRPKSDWTITDRGEITIFLQMLGGGTCIHHRRYFHWCFLVFFKMDVPLALPNNWDISHFHCNQKLWQVSSQSFVVVVLFVTLFHLYAQDIFYAYVCAAGIDNKFVLVDLWQQHQKSGGSHFSIACYLLDTFPYSFSWAYHVCKTLEWILWNHFSRQLEGFN